MKLRIKMLLIVAAITAGFLVVLVTASNLIILRGFSKIEEQSLARDVMRTLNSLSGILENLNSTCGDWAHWDDTHDFAATGNRRYPDENLSLEDFRTLRINLFVIADPHGRILLAKATDLSGERETPPPPDLDQILAPTSPIMTMKNLDESRTGVVLLSGKPVLVAAQLITTSKRQGPARGVLIMGRFLDEAEVGRLASLTSQTLRLLRLDRPGLPDDILAVSNALQQGESMVIRPLSGSVEAGYALIRDIGDRPGLLLEVEAPRVIHQKGIQSITWFLLLLLLAGLAFGMAFHAHLERTVISHLTRLNSQLDGIAESGDLTVRVGFPGRDEVAGLSQAVDGMLERLRCSTEEMLKHRNHLENMVETRTASLRDAEEAVRQSGARYRRLFVQSRDVIIITCGDDLIDTNPAGLQLLEVSKEAVLKGIPLSTFFDPEDCRTIKERIVAHGFVQEFETRLRLRNGQERTVLISATGHSDGEGAPLACQGIVRDVTQKRIMERQMVQMERMESMGHLAGGMAHDFNNVLTAIITHLDKVKRNLAPGDPLVSNCKAMEKAAHLGTNLTTALMAFAHGDSTPHNSVDLNGLVKDVIDIIRRTFPRSICMEYNLDGSLPTMEGDGVAMQRAVMNLCINARDAMPDGGAMMIETAMVDISPGDAELDPRIRPGRFVTLAVGDTGIGMTAETMQRMYEPFFTTKPKHQGTGLGLSIVYGVVRRHGGFIAVTSHPGKGSRFLLHLPVAT